MNELEAKEYQNRWRAVAAVELEEQRSASVALRWQQLNSILCLAKGLGLSLESDDSERLVWERWAKLKTVQT
jgi:hypothetical protein